MEIEKEKDLLFTINGYEFSTYTPVNGFINNTVHVYILPKDKKWSIENKILQQLSRYEYFKGKSIGRRIIYDDASSSCKFSEIVDHCLTVINTDEFFKTFWNAILQSKTKHLRFGLIINLSR
jgi:hypothetical protein